MNLMKERTGVLGEILEALKSDDKARVAAALAQLEKLHQQGAQIHSPMSGEEAGAYMQEIFDKAQEEMPSNETTIANL